MKKGWKTTTLGKAYDVRDGTHDSPKYHEAGYPLITSKNLKSEGLSFDDVQLISEQDYTKINQRSAVHKGDVLFAMIGTIGNPTLVEVEPDFAIKNVALFKVPSGQSGAFLKHYLDSGWVISKMSSESKGTTQKFVGLGYLRGFPIALPPLAEQQRIVGLLEEAFEGIATAKANAKKNLQNARALFESHLESVFTQRGPGWVEKTIGETCTLRSGTTVSPTLEKPIGDIPYLKVADMSFDGNEDQITTSSRFLCDADVRENAIIPKGATIFPKRGGAILTNKKRITSLPICADLNIMAVIPSSQIDAGLLYFYFLNVDMRKLGTGSSIPQINNYDVSPLLISFPKSLATQSQIVSKLDSLREETERLAHLYERKLAALEALKKSMLHQAFTGEL